MLIPLDINETQIVTTLRSFLLSILDPSVKVIRSQVNRVPEPAGTSFVEMTPLFQERLATNIDNYQTTLFTGSIAGTTLTIATISLGSVMVGSTIFGAGVTAGTRIVQFISGTGGVGTYKINSSQTIALGNMQAGTKTAQQYTQVTVQLDVHGEDSADNAQRISTLFRDEYGTSFFEQAGYDMAPLYTSDPRQTPFINGEQQYEDRWTVDAVLEANPILTIPQQFATLLGPVVLHDEI